VGKSRIRNFGGRFRQAAQRSELIWEKADPHPNSGDLARSLTSCPGVGWSDPGLFDGGDRVRPEIGEPLFLDPRFNRPVTARFCPWAETLAAPAARVSSPESCRRGVIKDLPFCRDHRNAGGRSPTEDVSLPESTNSPTDPARSTATLNNSTIRLSLGGRDALTLWSFFTVASICCRTKASCVS